jgi:putative tricarboxylic transport membrane protein
VDDKAQERSISTLPHFLVAAGVLVLAGLSAWQAMEIPKGSLFASVGPDVAPKFVTAFMVATGIGLIIAALRGGWAQEQDGTITEWGSLGLVALGLFVNAALIDVIGFILAATLMFPLVARGFGSLNPLRDVAIGFTLSFISYVGFDRVLGYKIGSGIIESLI